MTLRSKVNTKVCRQYAQQEESPFLLVSSTEFDCFFLYFTMALNHILDICAYWGLICKMCRSAFRRQSYLCIQALAGQFPSYAVSLKGTFTQRLWDSAGQSSSFFTFLLF